MPLRGSIESGGYTWRLRRYPIQRPGRTIGALSFHVPLMTRSDLSSATTKNVTRCPAEVPKIERKNYCSTPGNLVLANHFKSSQASPKLLCSSLSAKATQSYCFVFNRSTGLHHSTTASTRRNAAACSPTAATQQKYEQVRNTEKRQLFLVL